MKRQLGVLAAVMLLVFFPIIVNASDSTVYGDFSEEFANLYEAMPDEVRTQFADVLDDPSGFDSLRSEMGLASLWTRVVDTLKAAWPSACSLTLRLLGLILCAGVFSQLHTALDARVSSEAFTLCTTLCFALSLTGAVNQMLASTAAYLDGLTQLVSGLAPVVCAVLAASGQITMAAVSHTSLMLMFTLLQNVANILLFPMVRVCYCLGIVGAVGGPVKTENIAKCLRKVLTVVLSFLTVLFIFVVGVQTALAKGADSLSVRTVKFALGNVIPLIGSSLSDALTTVTGSLDLIRSVTGGLGVLSLVILLLPVLLQLMLYRLSLGICKGAAEMIGCDYEARLIGEMHGTVGFLLAAAALVSVMFLFVLSLFTLIGGSV